MGPVKELTWGVMADRVVLTPGGVSMDMVMVEARVPVDTKVSHAACAVGGKEVNRRIT